MRLMGGMLADAYADACVILTQQPRLATASHLLSHLAREIDSGLRELLTAMLPTKRQEHLDSLREEGSRDAPRRHVIAEICDFLGVPTENEVCRVWVSLEWHGRAHRGPLREPRTLDDRFLRSWNQFDYVLHEVARRFEASFLTALPLIDALAALTCPTKDDLARLKNQVPQSMVAMERFYAAAGPGWFPLLRRGGFFRNPANLRPDDAGMVTYVPWPAGPYLVRMAAEPKYAAEVITLFSELDTDNPQAGESAADVALVVSPKHAARLAAKLTQFLASFAQWALPSKASEVVVRLAAEGEQHAALTIVQALMPVPNRGAARRRFIPVALSAPVYIDLGMPIIVVLADLLCAADEDPDNDVTLAYSSMWRPVIERDRYRDSRDKVLSALRDAATAVAGSVNAAAVVEVLDGYEPIVFTRLSLHVLTRFPDLELVSARLTSAELFRSSEVAHEYTQLLRAGYRLLKPEDKVTIAGFIEAGPQWEASADDVERWKLGQLARFGDELPDELREPYETLVKRHGQPTQDDDPFEFAEWPGTHSPIDAAGIAELSDDELLSFLRTWQAPGGWRTPTVEGLRNQLEEAVAANPARFAALSPRFIDLAPDYGAAVLVALTRVLSADRPNPPGDDAPDDDDTWSTGAEPFGWDDVLDFAQAVIDTSRSQDDQQPQSDLYGLTWHDCCRNIAELLTAAMQRQWIHTTFAERVLALIRELAEDPRSRPGQQIVLDGDDPVAETLKTTRALALVAAMQFLQWISGDHDATAAPTASVEDVVALLNAHLDPAVDDSHAVRSVYGMYFGVLATLLGEWTHAHRAMIFSDGDDADLGSVAWQSFLRCNRPSEHTFRLLAEQYGKAVVDLTGRAADAEDHANRAASEAVAMLLDHLATLYGLGLIGLKSDTIIALFAEDVPVEYRARMLEICGQMLSNTAGPAPAIVERLQALWDWRADELDAGRTQVQELAGFGSWISSENFPASWALMKLRALLTAGGCPEPSDMVAERLAGLRQEFMAEAVACTSLLIDAPTDPWFIDASRNEISAVLAEGVKADDPEIRKVASETVNRLVARGRISFAQLLS
ncbi:hypothetical protein GCM10009780_75520 [Actinomadura alba]